MYQLSYATGLQYKCDSLYPPLYAHHHGAGCPSCREQVHGSKPVQVHCSLQSSFVWLFSFHTLCWAEPHIHFLHARWLRQILLSIHYFREGHLHNQLMDSTDVAPYLKQRPPYGPLCVERSSVFFGAIVTSRFLFCASGAHHPCLSSLSLLPWWGFFDQSQVEALQTHPIMTKGLWDHQD